MKGLKLFLFYCSCLFTISAWIGLDFHLLKTKHLTPGKVQTALQEELGNRVEIEGITYAFPNVLTLKSLSLYAPGKQEPFLSVPETRIRLQQNIIGRFFSDGEKAGEDSASYIPNISPSLILLDRPKFHLSVQDDLWNVEPFIDRIPATGKLILPAFSVKTREGRLDLDIPKYLRKNHQLHFSGLQLSLRKMGLRDQFVLQGEAKESILGNVTFGGTVKEKIISFNARKKNVSIDKELIKHLDREIRDIHEKFHFLGRADLTFRTKSHVNPDIDRYPEEKFPKFFINARDLEGKYQEIPYFIRDIQGKIQISEAGITFASVQGTPTSSSEFENAPIHLSGRVEDLDEPVPYDVRLSSSTLWFDEELLESLPPDTRDFMSSLNLNGEFSFTGRFWREPGKAEKERREIRIHPQQCDMKYEKFPYPFKNITGSVRITEDIIEVEGLSGNPDIPEEPRVDPEETRVYLTGFHWLNQDQQNQNGDPASEPSGSPESNLMVSEKQQNETSFMIRAENALLNETLRNVLPAPIQNIWKTYRPSGSGDMQWKLFRKKEQFTSAKPKIQHRLSIQFQNCIIWPEQLPEPVRSLDAHLNYDGDMVKITGARGRFSQGDIRGHGKINLSTRETSDERSRKDSSPPSNPSPDRTSNMLFFVEGENVAVTDPVKKFLLSTGSPTFKAIENQGSLDFQIRLDKSFAEHNSAGLNSNHTNASSNKDQNTLESPIHYYGKVNFSDMALNTSPPVTGLTGEAILEGEVGTSFEKKGIIGRIFVDRIRINGFPLQSLESTFQVHDQIELNDIRVQAFDGSVTGNISFDPKTTKFSLRSQISDLDIDTFVRKTQLRGRTLQGSVDGHLSLSGKADTPESWSGNGELWGREAKLWDLPVFLSIFTELSLKRKEQFNRGYIRLGISQKKINLHEMLFSSEGTTILGEGELAFDGRILIQIDSKISNKIIPSIPVLEQVLNLTIGQLEKNLFTFQVTGHFLDPVLVLKPLPFLSKSKLEETEIPEQK